MAPPAFSESVCRYCGATWASNPMVRILSAARSASAKVSNGPTRTRVRVGPFETEAEAERVADKVRAMGLDAQLAPQ